MVMIESKEKQFLEVLEKFYCKFSERKRWQCKKNALNFKLSSVRIKVCIGAFIEQLFWRCFSIIRWNWYHDPVFVLYLSSKVKTKLLIISVKYFIPSIFLEQRMWKWFCFYIVIFRFKARNDCLAEKREVFVFIGNKDYRS